MSYEIEIVQRRAQPAVVMRGHVAVPEIPGFLAGVFAATAAAIGRQRLSFAGPPFSRYTPAQDGSFDVEAGFPVAGPAQPTGQVAVSWLPAGPAARTMHVGPYDTIGLAYEAVEKWAAEHGYDIAGAPWESYLDEPGVQNPRTEVVFPIRRAG
jgi:effector-binding domain-containing protein